MTDEREVQSYQIPAWKQVLQIPARFVVDRIFPTEELDSESKANLKLAHEMLIDGYGMIVPINHFAKPEFFYLFSTLFRDSEFSRRGGLMALGAHEYRWFITYFASLVGVDTMPIVVPSSIKAMGTKAGSIGKGLNAYMEAGSERLAHGGTDLAVPQGQREPRLGEPRSTLIYDLLSEAQDQGAEKLAVMPAGIGLVGDANYEDRGFHFFERGVVRFRQPRTYEFILAVCGENPKGIEKFVFDELRQAVPENYR